jgi:hypothetical protein
MSVRTTLNKNYGDLMMKLSMSFQDIPGISEKLNWARSLPADSADIFDRLVIGLDTSSIDKLYACDISFVLLRPPVGLVEETCAHLVISRFHEDERHTFWALLHDMVRLVTVIKHTGSSLPIFENVAKTFLGKNAGIDPATCQQEIFKQFFQNGDLKAQLSSLFDSDEMIPSLFGNVGELLHGVGLAQGSEPCDEGKPEESEEPEDPNRKTTPGAAFTRKLRNRRNTTAKKQTVKKDPIAQMTEILSNITITKEDVQEMRTSLQSALAGNTISDMSDLLGVLQLNVD